MKKYDKKKQNMNKIKKKDNRQKIMRVQTELWLLINRKIINKQEYSF